MESFTFWRTNWRSNLPLSQVTSELDVFHAARAWIDHSKTERIKHVGEVMGCVRFYHISPDDIVQYVEPHSHYFKGPGGQEVLLGIYR